MTIKNSKKTIVVAMSGGVDSSTVAAMLHDQGYKVIGLTMQLYDHGAAVQKKGACCAGQDIYDAKMVADKLNIPHYILNYENNFKTSVIDDFVESYLNGETPLPCVRCNQSVKFKDMLKLAKELGADALATGHYVRKIKTKNASELHAAIDPTKDQSYFLFAWLIGSVIVVQLGFASGAVASSWSTYFQGMLAAGGIKLPAAIATVENGIMNLPAIMISLFIGFVLYLGTRDSKILNAVLVFTKMAAIFIFILTAAPHFDATNWENFTPNGTAGVLAGASILFFAFNGFNTIAAAAEECKNPKRDITIGIIGSLVLSTAVYVVVAGLLTGMAPLEMLNNAESLAVALRYNNSSVGSAIVAIGAVCGMATVLMMNIYGQSRIFYVISRDGLLPKSMAKLHPKHDSPYVTLLIFTSLAAILGGFFPTLLLGELSSMGSLIDFAAVSLIVMIFRLRFPDVERPFKCPILFIIAPTAIICTCYLLILQVYRDGEFLKTGKIMLVWFAIMAVLYIIRVTIFKREDDFSITEE